MAMDRIKGRQVNKSIEGLVKSRLSFENSVNFFDELQMSELKNISNRRMLKLIPRVISSRPSYYVQELKSLQMEERPQIQPPSEFFLMSKIDLAEDIVFEFVWVKQWCTAYNRATTKPLCRFLNVCRIHYDDRNGFLLINSSDQTRGFSCIPIESIRRGRPEEGKRRIFDWDENIQYGRHWIFDLPVRRTVAFDARKSEIKVFEMENYTLKYEFPIPRGAVIIWLKSFQNAVIASNSENGQKVSMELICKDDGRVLKKMLCRDLYPIERTEYMIMYDDDGKILLKQESKDNIDIVDISSNTHQMKIPNINYASHPTYLPTRKNFLNMTQFQHYMLWDLELLTIEGELVRKLDDHTITSPLRFKNYITDNEGFILSCCVFFDEDSEAYHSLNISSLSTGKCLGKITDEIVSEVLGPLAYDETTDEILTVHNNGRLYLWRSVIPMPLRLTHPQVGN